MNRHRDRSNVIPSNEINDIIIVQLITNTVPCAVDRIRVAFRDHRP